MDVVAPPARHATGDSSRSAGSQFARDDAGRAAPGERTAPEVLAAPSLPLPAPAPAPVRAGPSNACDWASVQAASAESRRQVKMVVEEAAMREFKDGCVSLLVAHDLLTAASGVQEDIRLLISKTWGRTVRVEFVSERPVTEPAKAGGAESGEAAPAGPTMTVANAAENPLIARAVELFGAKILGVYPRQK